MPTLIDPIKCRWCSYTIRHFATRETSTVRSAWDLLRHHIYDVHPGAAELFGAIPRAVAADVFGWDR